MSLPSTEALQTSKFPGTAEQASQIFHDAQAVSRLTDEHTNLLSVLLQNSHGARGLFVSLLSDENVQLADTSPPDDVLIKLFVQAGVNDHSPNDGGKLRQAHYIRELAIKNVVMPSAMVVTYGLRGDVELKDASMKTRDRAIRVLAAWHHLEAESADHVHDPAVREVALQMRDALTGQGGPYEPFVNKWGYGQNERVAMVDALRQVFGNQI